MWRGVLAVSGTVLILFAVVFVVVDARVLSDAPTPGIPNNETLSLTVPKMQRVNNVPVYTAASSDEAKLRAGAIRVRGTGLPWESDANVYIAGHRLGYPKTRSFLLFYDLDKLGFGDRVVLRDASGRRYVYRVFNKLVVEPNDLSVTKSVPGKEVVSLQACTLPTYTQRLVVQAELVRVGRSPGRTASATFPSP
jgi:sortase A